MPTSMSSLDSAATASESMRTGSAAAWRTLKNQQNKFAPGFRGWLRQQNSPRVERPANSCPLTMDARRQPLNSD